MNNSNQTHWVPSASKPEVTGRSQLQTKQETQQGRVFTFGGFKNGKQQEDPRWWVGDNSTRATTSRAANGDVERLWKAPDPSERNHFIGKSLSKELHTELVRSHLAFLTTQARPASLYRTDFSENAQQSRPVSARNYEQSHLEARRNKALARGSSVQTAFQHIS